jgi:hypothetical protein
MEAEVTASAPNHRYQGTLALFLSAARPLVVTCGVERGILDMEASQNVPMSLSYNVATPPPPLPITRA